MMQTFYILINEFILLLLENVLVHRLLLIITYLHVYVVLLIHSLKMSLHASRAKFTE